MSVLEVEGAQTNVTGVATFDLNRKDSDLDRKLDWINQLTATEEEESRDVASKDKGSKSEVLKAEAQKEARKDGLTKKATVIRYDVVDSDDSESSDDADSDDEVPHVYGILTEEAAKSGRQEAEKMVSSIAYGRELLFIFWLRGYQLCVTCLSGEYFFIAPKASNACRRNVRKFCSLTGTIFSTHIKVAQVLVQAKKLHVGKTKVTRE